MPVKTENPSLRIFSKDALPEHLAKNIHYPTGGVVMFLGCWIWHGSILGGYNGGYGRFYDRERKMTIPSHRAVWEILVGPIPPKYHLDHLCRVRRCCNPAHLEAITAKENSRRRVLSTRAVQIGDNPVETLMVNIPILDTGAARA